ncbi:MAG: hypothetical protein ACQEWT_14570 [Bacillota bacterium]
MENIHEKMDEALLEILKDLVSRSTLKKFNRDSRKIYKLLLCGVFGEIIHNGAFYRTDCYKLAYDMNEKYDYCNRVATVEMYEELLEKIESSFNFFDLRDSNYVNEVTGFLRRFINESIAKKKRLYLYSEVENLYDFKLLYSGQYQLKSHHWIDINIYHFATPTLPEYYNYIDLINSWNDFINKSSKFREIHFSMEKEEKRGEIKELEYSINSNSRFLIILAITFVESYLYYYFYNIKADESKNGNEKVAGFLKKSKVDDTDIIKKLIFKLHNEIAQDEEVKTLFNRYTKHNNLRNRFVHASAFIDESNQMSQLQPLLNLTQDKVCSICQDCVDFVVAIDEKLPEDERLLFWWDQYQTPNFKKMQHISTLNKNKM